MPLEIAFRLARDAFKGLEPYVVAAKSSASYQEGKFSLKLFQRSFTVSFPEGEVGEIGAVRPPEADIQLTLLHYLAKADGTFEADQWISARDLPSGIFAENKFHSQATIPLVRAFGHNLKGLERACLSLGGTPMSRTGDFAVRLLALPRLPMAVVLYLGEDPIPPSVNVLFDASAPHYLPTDDLFHLGIYLAEELRKHGEQR